MHPREMLIRTYFKAVFYGKLYWILQRAVFLCPEWRTDETRGNQKDKKKNRYDTE